MFVDLGHIADISKKIYSILQNKAITNDLIQKGITNIKRFSTEKKDTRKHFQTMGSLSEMFLSVGELRRRNQVMNDRELLRFAAEYNLQCSYESDVLLCMHLMIKTLNLELPGMHFF